MIKKFNEYESINEKWGMEYIVPVLISMGLVNRTEAQEMTTQQIETIVQQNPEINDTIKNKMIIKESLNQLEEIKNALKFLDTQSDFDVEKLKQNLEVAPVEPNVQQKLMSIISGSGIFQVPKLGSFTNLVINLDKKTSISIGSDPFGKSIGFKKTIGWNR